VCFVAQMLWVGGGPAASCGSNPLAPTKYFVKKGVGLVQPLFY